MSGDSVVRGCRLMENLYLSVIPAEAGIHWLQVLRDSRFRGSDDGCAFVDTLVHGNGDLRLFSVPFREEFQVHFLQELSEKSRR